MLKVLGNALLCVPFVALHMAYSCSYLVSTHYLESPLWQRYKPWTRLSGAKLTTYLSDYLRLVVVGVIVGLLRWKYYMGWYIAEAAHVACGYGYNGTDEAGHVSW